MPQCVSSQLYLLLDALQNSDILLHNLSHEISNFQTHLKGNTAERKHIPI